MPARIVRRRSRGWKMPENTIYVGRPTKWGNPYRVVGDDRASAVELYRQLIVASPKLLIAAQKELRGKNLACWCREGEPCHVDVLLELANK